VVVAAVVVVVVVVVGGGSAAGAVVVKVHESAAASAVPPASLTLVSMFAVYVVPFASGPLGVSVAVDEAESYDTLAATGALAPCAVSVKLDDVIVEASIAPENTALTEPSVATPVAPAAGVVEVTDGALAACAAERPNAAIAATTSRTTNRTGCIRPGPP
jgi:hypothetical protein